MSSFDLVDQLLSNEDVGIKESPKKKNKGPAEPYVRQPKRKKYKSSKPATDADLKLSGWNLEFDEGYEEVYVVGDIIEGIKVLRLASLYAMACVYSAEHCIYGWGSNVGTALKQCRNNINGS